MDNCVSETASTKEHGVKRKKGSAYLDNCVSEAASTSSDDCHHEITQEMKQSVSLQQRIAALGGNGTTLSAWRTELDAMEFELRKEYAVYRAAEEVCRAELRKEYTVYSEAKNLSADKAEQKGKSKKTQQVKYQWEYEDSQQMDSQM